MRPFTRTTERSEAAMALHAQLEAANLQAQVYRNTLQELVRGIETAPQSTYLDWASLDAATAQAVRPAAAAVQAPHVTWRPLNVALTAAHRVLAGPR